MGGQRRAALGAVGHDLVVLVEQPGVPDLAQRPPHRLDVVVVQRAVGVVQVQPEADALGERVPLLQELEHGLAAALVELGDAVALDVVLVPDAELALDLDLHRQAVAVPAALALHRVPAHGLVAGEQVLEHAGEDVVGARTAVGGGRALVEHPGGRALAPPDRLAEDVALAPAAQDLLLQRGKRGARIDGTMGRAGGHRRPILGGAPGPARRPDGAQPPGGASARARACASTGDRVAGAAASSRSRSSPSSRASRATSGSAPSLRTVLAPVSGRAPR